MSALRRSSSPLAAPSSPSRPAIGVAGEESKSARNPVLEQQARIATAFDAERRGASYPGSVKLAIVFGAPLAMWGGLIGAGFWIANRLG